MDRSRVTGARAAVPVFPSAFLAGPGFFGLRRRNRPIGKGRSVLAGALFTLGLVVGLAAPTDVKAAVFYPGDMEFDDLISDNNIMVFPSLGFTASPLNALYVIPSNANIVSQNPGIVETFLESSAGFNTPLTFVGGGDCPSIVSCDDAGSGSLSGVIANVFGVHFDNQFLAFLYPGPIIPPFTIEGLPHGVSNIYAFNTSVVPLPAALPLYGSALAVLGLIGWRRKRMAA